MSWVATAIAGAGALSAYLGSEASGDAASAANRGSREGIAETRRQFDTIMGLQQPAIVTGTGAYNKIARLLGLPYQEYQAPTSTSAGPAFSNPRLEKGQRLSFRNVNKLLKRGSSIDDILEFGYLGGRVNPERLRKLERRGVDAEGVARLMGGPAAARAAEAGAADDGVITPEGPDESVFTESPDYQFRLREGINAIDRGAAARGGALSGNAARGVAGYASDLASTEYGNFFERLMRVAGLGGAATNTASSAAAATGANVSGLLAQQGQSRASGILGQANSLTNAANTGLNAWLLSRGGYFNAPGATG